jgi:protein involved in polysaccharide export with SLBB domain
MKNSDDGGFVVARMVCVVQTASLLAISLLALTLFCSPGALSQESHPQYTSSTELGRENLARVAASVQEIKLLLLKDSGLMVEVKRWMAKEATSNGQVINDMDLTDDAIFDRLVTDMPFRSAVTLILQKYGHLLPKLNPESEAAKERELVLQERARMLAQAHQTDVASLQQSAAPGRWYANVCGPQTNEKCLPSGDTGTEQPGPGLHDYVSPPITTPQVPLRPGSPNRAPGPADSMQINYAEDKAENLSPMAGIEDANQAIMRRGAGATSPEEEQGPSTALPGAITLDGTGVGLTGNVSPNSSRTSPGGQNQDSDHNLVTARESSPATPTGSFASQPLGPRQNHRNSPSGAEAPDLVRTANPYKEIPSLYDMYVQAVPRPTVPRRFGLQVFENGTRDSHLIPMDLTVGPDYVVGPGDGLSIDLWGGITQRLYRVVDHSGQISLPDVGPVLVSGKSLADVQRAVEKQLSTLFRDLSADVSLSRMRTIRVYEVGEVANPGAYDVSSLSTPLNALFVAGGPTSKGSLRLVKHVRDGQVLEVVDLYDLLLNGVRPDLKRLENGDTILVPPIGPQVTVEGMIRRPAIYELNKEQNLSSVLELAGGLLPTASYRHIEVQRVVAHEKQTMLDLEIQDSDSAEEVAKKLASFAVKDGDRIRVFAIAPYNQDVIYLAGHAAHPGLYSFHSGMRVTDVIASYKDLLPEPANQYAEIIRLNAPDFHPSVESFDLAEAIRNPSQAPALQPLDTIRVFSRFDFEAPPTVSVWGEVRAPGTYGTSGQIRLSDAIHLAGGLISGAIGNDVQVVRYLSDGQTRISSVDLRLAVAGDPKANILLQPRDQLLIHRNPNTIERPTVYVQGEVGKPGRYPLAADMTVADLIRISGGLKPGADTHLADLTSYQWSGKGNLEGNRQTVQIASALADDPYANLKLSNGSVLTVRQLPGWNDLGAAISVKGQVNHPGSYGIRPGERLSSILERVGGFPSDAYVYGAVLERAQVRELETKQQTEMILRIKDMQTNIQMLPENTPEQKRAKEVGLQQYQSTLSQLSSNMPIGRITIHVTSDINRWKGTAVDLEVRAGDVLFIPKRPSFIMVAGQVFNPTAVGYRPGKSGNWYLSQSGGPTVLADKKAIFVIRADGSVIGRGESAWSGNSLGEVLQPGDTVIVPEKAVGGNIQWQTIFMAAQVASAIASTAILAVKL